MARFKASAVLSLISKIIRPRFWTTKAPRVDATVRGPPLEHQKSSQIVQLPDDILAIIADHLSLTDRAHLLQTCRYLHSLLEVTQYRHVTASSLGYYQRDRLHRTLSERPDLIHCIVSYRGPLVPMAAYDPIPRKKGILLRLKKGTTPLDPPFTETEWFRRSIYIFTNAVNLLYRFQRLAVRSDLGAGKNVGLEDALTHLALPRMSDPAEAVSLLRTLPGLEYLELSWARGGLEDLKEGDIPKLKWLGATLQDAAAIVPGRPVEEFHDVTTVPGLDEQHVWKLSLSSSPITKLTTRLRNWDYDLVQSDLQVFARHLPEIRHLEITVDGAIPGQLLLDEIPSFQSLRSVKFLSADLLPTRDQARITPCHSIDSDSDRGGTISRQDPMVEDWDVLEQMLQERCPSLVDMEHTPRPIDYLRICGMPPPTQPWW